ncbi:hypothetical protein ACEWY4_014011 [Coilia grayii]|uniref:Gypsy retrotransposon integrase-like protein 1 n=1 Tax=Coilia grayii TaxID=363190 RepID=A0ABD1JR24_9TELE
MEQRRFEAAEREKVLALRRFEAAEREKERQLEYERLKLRDREVERENSMQLERLRLIAEGKLAGGEDSSRSFVGATSEESLSSMLKFLPKFNDRDPDIFFSLFEGIADERNWSDSVRTLLLQSVFTGKAQEAFIALSVSERKKYKSVKEPVLRAFEQVPEFYRQRFRNWRKGERQTFSEVARDLTAFFNRWCVSVNVSTFEALCDLIILEQFKNVVPERIAVFINEHKVTTAAEAAVLADEFVLTHRGKSRDLYTHSREEHRPFVSFSHSAGRQDRPPGSSIDQEKCNYCLQSGHWKRDCPALRTKNKNRSNPPRSVVCVAPVKLNSAVKVVESQTPSVGTVPTGLSVCEVPECPGEEPCCSEQHQLQASEGYGPFITTGYISLLGSSERKPVRMLRDTGASETFVVESALPFSPESSTGKCVLIRGIGMQTLSVPLHQIEFHSDLVQGEALVAVRSSLPVEGVEVILGNNLAGDRVWPDVPSPPVVCSEVFSDVQNVDACVSQFPEVFTACAVTRAKSRAQAINKSSVLPQLHSLPASLSRSEVILAQTEDEELGEALAGALPGEKMQCVDGGYFVLDGLLVRKYLPYNTELEDAVVQVVLPKNFRQCVLQTAHGDVAGHFGIKKTYMRLLQHFYWPRMKRDVSSCVSSGWKAKSVIEASTAVSYSGYGPAI